MTTRREPKRAGTGITERAVEDVTIRRPRGPADKDAVADILRKTAVITINGDRGEFLSLLVRHPFGPDADLIEQRARSILARTDRQQFEEDSREGYASRALRLLDHVRQFIAKDDAEAAAHYAMKLGALLMQEEMKFRHEPAALTGLKQRNALSDIRQRVNRERHESRSQEWAHWQAEAERIWRGKPSLRKSAVAGRVKSILKLPDAIDTIARRIKKSREAR